MRGSGSPVTEVPEAVKNSQAAASSMLGLESAAGQEKSRAPQDTILIPAPSSLVSKIAMFAVAMCIAVTADSGAASPPSPHPDKQRSYDWPIYGGSPDNNHFSPLAQINRKNVKQLSVAWSFDTEESGGLQTSPIEVDGVLYGITPTQKVFALDAATGKLLWKFASGIKGTQPDRGLAYWADGRDHRIIVGVMNFVYALDAADGKPIAAFGNNGRIDLRENLGRDPAQQSIYMTSPAVIYKDLMIVGGRESETLPASPGDVRAYDVRK